MAADSIEELLHQDEVDGHNDALRRDLNALTEEQWQYYFKVERKQPDIELGGQLIVRESEERPRVLYIWVAAIAAGFGIAIGAIQAAKTARRNHRFTYSFSSTRQRDFPAANVTRIKSPT